MSDDDITESWLCIDCRVNTAPGIPDGPTARAEFEHADKYTVRVGANSEVYMVRDAVWRKAGIMPFGGCLCIGCLELRLGRKLKPKDFDRHHPFNNPSVRSVGTERSLKRRK
jgi:hypothetical protein